MTESAKTVHVRETHQLVTECVDRHGVAECHVRVDRGHFVCMKECGFATAAPIKMQRHYAKCDYVVGQEEIGLPKDAVQRVPLGDEIRCKLVGTDGGWLVGEAD